MNSTYEPKVGDVISWETKEGYRRKTIVTKIEGRYCFSEDSQTGWHMDFGTLLEVYRKKPNGKTERVYSW